MNSISPAQPPTESRGREAGPWRTRVALVLLTFIGYCGLIGFPELLQRLGLGTHGVWFVDSYALLAAGDAVRLGLDPWQPNPLDVYERPHVYPGWWLALGRIGLTRDDNFLLGGIFVALFFAAAFLHLVPRRKAALGWYLALLFSPPVMLAVNRANNDLVIFSLLGFGLWLMGRGGGARPAWFVAAVALATGLKFYPLVATGGLGALHPARRALAWTIGATAMAALVLANGWSDLQRADIPSPSGTHVFGATVFWRHLVGMEGAAALASLVVLGGGATALALRGWTKGLAAKDEPANTGERLAFVVGALLLLGCFAAGTSFAYRWLFALLLAPWLWSQAWENTVSGTARSAARLALVLLTVALWMDGLYCAVTNTFIGPMEASRFHRWEAVWQITSQPIVWGLMLLLAGWLMNALHSVGRSARDPAVE